MTTRVERREHVFWLAVGLVILSTSVIGRTEGDGTVRVAGLALPPTCQVKLWTGADCAGCGLTRSFVAIAHGQPAEAWRRNWIGLPLFALLSASTLWRLVVLARPSAEERWGQLVAPGWWTFCGLMVAAVVVWAIRLALSWFG